MFVFTMKNKSNEYGFQGVSVFIKSWPLAFTHLNTDAPRNGAMSRLGFPSDEEKPAIEAG